MMGFDLYQAITDRIISELEKGTVPWQRPWTCPTGAISHVTGKCDILPEMRPRDIFRPLQ